MMSPRVRQLFEHDRQNLGTRDRSSTLFGLKFSFLSLVAFSTKAHVPSICASLNIEKRCVDLLPLPENHGLKVTWNKAEVASF